MIKIVTNVIGPADTKWIVLSHKHVDRRDSCGSPHRDIHIFTSRLNINNK
jgi:hypothetical protein